MIIALNYNAIFGRNTIYYMIAYLKYLYEKASYMDIETYIPPKKLRRSIDLNEIFRLSMDQFHNLICDEIYENELAYFPESKSYVSDILDINSYRIVFSYVPYEVIANGMNDYKMYWITGRIYSFTRSYDSYSFHIDNQSIFNRCIKLGISSSSNIGYRYDAAQGIFFSKHDDNIKFNILGISYNK